MGSTLGPCTGEAWEQQLGCESASVEEVTGEQRAAGIDQQRSSAARPVGDRIPGRRAGQQERKWRTARSSGGTAEEQAGPARRRVTEATAEPARNGGEAD